jgi:hypothetical protein
MHSAQDGFKTYQELIITPVCRRSVVSMRSKIRYSARLWYYFRVGYSTYLTFLLGYTSTLVTVYYLAIKNLPSLLDLFPHFVPFAIIASVIGAPLSVLIGWVHLKRSPVFSSEADIGVEANPYTYKLSPGVWREVFAPTYQELLVQQKALLAAQNLLTDEEKSRIESLERKLQTLIDGGFVGRPSKSKI